MNNKCTNSKGLVSVVIPTYNQKEFIHETIESVLAQTYKKIEIIVTDDGSTDGTVEIIKEFYNKFPDKIIPVFSEKNTGIPFNINRGLNHVTGEYLAWLGGDDLMLPTKLEKQVLLLEKRKDAVGCIHDALVFQSENNQELGKFSELYNGSSKFKEGGVELWLKTSYRMLPSTVMIRTCAIPDHGTDIRLKYANDLLFDIEVFRQGACVVIDEVLGKYRRHKENVTSSEALRCTVVEEILLALSIVDSRYPDLFPLTRKRRIGLFIKEAVMQYKNGNKETAFSYLKIAIKSGALVKGGLVYLSLWMFGGFITRLINANRYENKNWVIKLLRIFNNE